MKVAGDPAMFVSSVVNRHPSDAGHYLTAYLPEMQPDDKVADMTPEEIADIRLWFMEKVADILVDLSGSDNPTPSDSPEDLEELREPFMYIGEMILDAVNFQVVASDGTTATVTIGSEPNPPESESV